MEGERRSYAAAIWKKNKYLAAIWNLGLFGPPVTHSCTFYLEDQELMSSLLVKKSYLCSEAKVLKVGLGRLGTWALLFLSFICHSLSLCEVEEGYCHQIILFCTKKTGMYCLLMVRQICWPLPVENPDLFLSSGSFHLTFPDHFITISKSNAKLGL